MPVIKKVKSHECWTPLVSPLNPRTWRWGQGTQWQCRKCKKEYVLREGYWGDPHWW